MMFSSLTSIHFKIQFQLPKNPYTKTQFGNRTHVSIYCSSSPSSSSNKDTTLFLPPPTTPTNTTSNANVIKKRKRYRKQYPGENKGIVEEMRFVAMKLRTQDKEDNPRPSDDADDDTWEPTIEGFLKFLVDSKLVFETLDRIVDESDHVAYAYFRKTGLERSEGLSKDLDWFKQQEIPIPQPSPPGISYANYLVEVAEKNAPSFVCHFYNIYFAHITGGQVIAKQVSEKILDGRVLEFCKWEGDVLELLKDMRENLNKLGEYWSRDQKNRCLREATKSFRFSGEIVRLIIL
ncbi:heme oxygenase 2 [Tasmannia lanceolata]|uniref:heme oxygenase 2 n=1 Tax=Tasmannia lanceolata TaxID=3420 RepID=UPI004062FD31